jgi:gas vesicle protein
LFNNGNGFRNFLIGLGIGFGLGLLVAPLSGEDTREWLSDTAEGSLRQLRRHGRRWIVQAQDVLDKGEDTVSKVLKNSKNALDSVASRLG